MTKPLRPDRPMSNTDRVAAKVSLVAADSPASDSSRRRFRLELENRHSRRGAGAVHRAESHGLVKESLAGSHGDRMDP